ncbi:hypothetical protein CEXT_408271 [Caerostris extrusa]|uniref:Uncharacterized protein n=1 Tax=Caerostris extrusa TaxID=172846 RepID=A0AAV4SG65_CAEEX|nr:hypothetical protein CEXT_408271 [Caerostris extrusa]
MSPHPYANGSAITDHVIVGTGLVRRRAWVPVLHERRKEDSSREMTTLRRDYVANPMQDLMSMPFFGLFPTMNISSFSQFFRHFQFF